MKITIVGGGTAGWIAAYFICNDHPGKHEITVIESSTIGIIGAGEGSTGTMYELLNGTYFNKSVDIDDFFNSTNGTKKLGIFHNNWLGDNTGYFAPIDTSPTWYNFEDKFFKYVLAEFGNKKIHKASSIGIDYEYNLNRPASAFHFDGHKVGEFFKKHCLADGVRIIDSVVKDVNLRENGDVDSVTLDSGDDVESDFFIDCTGFAKILANKVGIGWKSYADYLPVNSAIPFQLTYDTNENVKPYTVAHALSSGWMWQIPLQNRKGCGYVYDDRFISKEDAIAELETTLGQEVEPIKHIKFEAGRSDNFWQKNVLVLGLSAAFVEPLEATSIHSTIIQLLVFSKEYLFNNAIETDKESFRREYNAKISTLYDNILDFISYHYQGGRQDSEFWNWVKNDQIVTPKAKHFKHKSQLEIPGFLEINGIIGSPNIGLWNWISAGLNIVSQSQAEKELTQMNKAEIQQQYEYFVSQHVNQKSYVSFV